MDDAILTIAMVISDCLLLQNVAFINLMYFLHTCQVCTCTSTFFFWWMSIYSMWHFPTHWHKAKSLMLFNYLLFCTHTVNLYFRMEDYKYLFKVVLIGEAGVGKTCLVRRFTQVECINSVSFYVYQLNRN